MASAHPHHRDHESAISEGAALGSTECLHVLAHWDAGVAYKYNGLLKLEGFTLPADHHHLFVPVLEGALKGSQKCAVLMDQWHPEWRTIKPVHHRYEDAINDGVFKGSEECKKVLHAWKVSKAYKFEGHKDTDVTYHNHPYFYAIKDGWAKGSTVCEHLMREWQPHLFQN